jgi:hypothetical protein
LRAVWSSAGTPVRSAPAGTLKASLPAVWCPRRGLPALAQPVPGHSSRSAPGSHRSQPCPLSAGGQQYPRRAVNLPRPSPRVLLGRSHPVRRHPWSALSPARSSSTPGPVAGIMRELQPCPAVSCRRHLSTALNPAPRPGC